MNPPYALHAKTCRYNRSDDAECETDQWYLCFYSGVSARDGFLEKQLPASKIIPVYISSLYLAYKILAEVADLLGRYAQKPEAPTPPRLLPNVHDTAPLSPALHAPIALRCPIAVTTASVYGPSCDPNAINNATYLLLPGRVIPTYG